MKIEDWIDKNNEDFLDLSDRIWGYSELKFQEYKSVEDTINLMKNNGFRVEQGIGGIDTAFICSYGEGKPIIGFLGEYDALDGLSQEADVPYKKNIEGISTGHGCGHQMLGASCALAAVALKEYMAKNKQTGTIRLYGCPGEEGGSGKVYMVREGLFDDLDSAITWHPKNQNSVTNRSSLANIQTSFRFKGRSSHAGSAPHLGRSALDALELMNIGANFLREHIIPDARIHYAITDAGGTSPNVVQSESEVVYLVRAPRRDQLEDIYERVCNIARGAALMTDTSLEIDLIKACSNTVVNEVLCEIMDKQFLELGNISYTDEEIDYAKKFEQTLTEEEKKHSLSIIEKASDSKFFQNHKEKILNTPLFNLYIPLSKRNTIRKGSTDVADVSWVTPTVQAGVACYCLGTAGHSWQKVAQGKSSIAHKGLIHAAKVMSKTGEFLLSNPIYIEKAKEELCKKIGNNKYICPIPNNVKPR